MGCTSYLYCASDPVNNVDPTGNIVNNALLAQRERRYDFDSSTLILEDWQFMTGLKLSWNDNNLQFNKGPDGKPIITQEIDSKGNLVNCGSASAREFLINAIESPDIVYLSRGYKCSGFVDTEDRNVIWICYEQIKEQIDGTIGVDNRTLGFGMVACHEMLHTRMGENSSDGTKEPYTTGPTVDKINVFRKELGEEFGQRLSYPTIRVKGFYVLPFDEDTLKYLQKGHNLSDDMRYVKFKTDPESRKKN